VTIAEVLKSAGYKTCHIGKWHLGEEPYYPEHQGFDINIGGCRSGMPRSFFWPDWKGNPPIVGRREGEYLPDRLADEAVRFIEGNKDQPFFLYLAHYAVHIPLQAKKPMIAKYVAKPKPLGGQDNPIYAAMVESIDESVGRVLDVLMRLGIEDRTVVIFTSDNGGLSVREGAHTPATCNAPLRGGKGHLYEGGIREPLIVKWPGVVQPGSICDVSVCSIDFFPTMVEMAGLGGIKTNGPIDGESIVPLLKQSGRLQREALYWHYPHFSNQGGRPGGVIRQGDFKLIERYEDGTLELYNLRMDIGETRNLAHLIPPKAVELHRRLQEWRQSVDANMPVSNPDFKPGPGR
ncbi:MAG: sulfatase, partial [Planctomycetota bacterium]